MEIQPSELSQKILEIITNAGEITISYFKKNLAIDYKEDEFDPVTIADKESDNFIRQQLEMNFPGELILSEENSGIPSSYQGRVWMVDPLNGTKSFIKGVDTFGIVIGLVENGVPIFGCISVPAQNKVFYAEKGVGSFEKAGDIFKKMNTSSITEIESSRLITREPSGEVRPIEELLNKISFMLRIEEGSGAKLCSIARGDAEAHINTNFKAGKWDIAAAQIILEEAGGVVTDLDDKPIDYLSSSVKLERSFVASANKELHKKIISELSKLKV